MYTKNMSVIANTVSNTRIGKKKGITQESKTADSSASFPFISIPSARQSSKIKTGCGGIYSSREATPTEKRMVVCPARDPNAQREERKWVHEEARSRQASWCMAFRASLLMTAPRKYGDKPRAMRATNVFPYSARKNSILAFIETPLRL
mmetsp:Transcript_15992/g.23876  ORF Transcript_15992/g.23876 Transcript_15992/m.23876 type:complete len:149 (-) Transcript_15992:198-644(-)